jgi:uncharacterized membrane protein YciS (DUF1049 family)
MHAAVKVIIGIIILLIGLGLFVDSAYSNSLTGIEIHWLENFVIVLTGVIPIMLILIGLFVIWLEVDELKAEKQFKMEEEKAKPETKPEARPEKKPVKKKK